jgi:hypothetical protein
MRPIPHCYSQILVLSSSSNGFFLGLCTMHHMTTAETTDFAALCSALLHEDNLSTLTVLDPITSIF